MYQRKYVLFGVFTSTRISGTVGRPKTIKPPFLGRWGGFNKNLGARGLTASNKVILPSPDLAVKLSGFLFLQTKESSK